MELKRVHVLVTVFITVLAVAIVIALFAARGPRAIRLAYQNRVASAIVIVAVEQDFFAAEGLTVQAHRFNSGPACSEALFSGSADIGTMGDTTAIIALARGAPLTMMTSHGQGAHRHRLVVRQDSELHQVGDLVGKRIGVKKGTSTYGGLLALLSHHQIDTEKLQLIDVRPADMPEALAAGSLDAFAASEPTPSLAELAGARELTTLGGLGHMYPILILARNSFRTSGSKDADRFMRALRRAEAFLHDHPDRATDIVANATGLPPEVARRAMQRHVYALRLDNSILTSLRKTAEFLREQGIIRDVPDLTARLNPP